MNWKICFLFDMSISSHKSSPLSFLITRCPCRYCLSLFEIVQALGFSTSFEAISVEVPDDTDEQWADIKRKYFFSDTCEFTFSSSVRVRSIFLATCEMIRCLLRRQEYRVRLLLPCVDYLPHCVLSQKKFGALQQSQSCPFW